ncbi:TD and POZ domain-containing protein 2-like [Microplitis mediator]|uniref:TD and POZ domain-containing protein 2-like n=1 Tax=Microplitis mediator TaxID=375433 RepID=UPI002556C184|nr:TD and POZ domain-containing protein 2-like [Microplitis mediator]
MNSKTEIVKYRWKIDDVIGSNSWVQSEQFHLCGNYQVGFDIGLRNTVRNQSSLQVRVRKNDLRPAKATVQIKQINTSQLSYRNGFYSFEEYPYSNPNSNPNASETILSVSEINNWQEFFTSDIVGYSNESSRVLPNDSYNIYVKMKIECEITFRGFINEKPEIIMPTSFERFLKADVFNDITLVVDGQQLPAHKIILSTHSPYFYAMLTTEMREVKENCITIKNFSLDVITEMLEFFYTGKTKASDNMDVALKMIEIAEMYQISKLKEICKSTLIRNININNVLSITNIADDLNVAQLRQKGIKFMVDNRKPIVKLPGFKDLCQRKPLLMYELTCAIGEI